MGSHPQKLKVIPTSGSGRAWGGNVEGLVEGQGGVRGIGNKWDCMRVSD